MAFWIYLKFTCFALLICLYFAFNNFSDLTQKLVTGNKESIRFKTFTICARILVIRTFFLSASFQFCHLFWTSRSFLKRFLIWLWLAAHQVAFESQILVDCQSRDSRTTCVCKIVGVILSWNLYVMTKLTLVLTLNDPMMLNRPWRRLQERFVCGWHWNLQNSNDSQHANYLRHWSLYNIEVVRGIVYLNLTAAWMMWVVVR